MVDKIIKISDYKSYHDREQQLRLEIDNLLTKIKIIEQEKFKKEIKQRKQAEKKLEDLVKIISQQRDDLEILLNILIEHGDVIDTHWSEKINEVNKLLMVDYLTKLLNRGGFDFYIHKQWEIAQQNNNYINLILIDIDYFKQYNDIYGHLKGDDCLQQIAKIIQKQCQQFDGMACRQGGEEFAIILTKTNLETARKLAEQIQEELAKLKIEHQGSLVNSYVTISTGISAIIPTVNLNPEEFINYTDQLLYLAKNQGRNQIIAQPMK